MRAQPVIHQQNRRCKAQDTYRHQIITHIYKRQQVRRQNNRIVQTIIGIIVNILPCPKFSRKLREPLSRRIKLLPKLIRNYAVLTEPVTVRCKKTKTSDQKPYHKQCQTQQEKISFISDFLHRSASFTSMVGFFP